MAGLTGNYITPFALALKATTAQIGLLTSVPSLLMSLAQLSAPRLSEKAGSRKALVLPTVFLHALMWLPVFLVPYLVPNGKVWWLVTFVSVSSVLGTMANPAWGSMMADLVPLRIRGRYFAARAHRQPGRTRFHLHRRGYPPARPAERISGICHPVRRCHRLPPRLVLLSDQDVGAARSARRQFARPPSGPDQRPWLF